MDYYRNAEDLPRGRERPLYNNFISKTFTAEAANAEPVTLAEVKSHLRITFTDDDTYLTDLIKRCRAEIEERDRKSYITRTVRALIKNELGGQELLFGPVTGLIEDITAVDLDGNVIEIGTNEIKGDGSSHVLVPTYDYIVLTYTAGMAPAVVPLSVKQDILELIAYKYTNRGDQQRTRRAGAWLA